jgi:hypothetical protein
MSNILVLDSHGQPNNWVNWQTAVLYQAKNMVQWSLGEIAVVAHGGKSRMTGEQSIITVPSIIAVKNKAYSKYRQLPLTNSYLFKRDLQICAYCGKWFRLAQLTRDHIKPTSKGGANTWMNCVTACKPCNNYKGDQSLSSIDMNLMYVPYVPDMFEGLILKGRNIRGDQMDFIKNFLPKHSRAHKLDS